MPKPIVAIPVIPEPSKERQRQLRFWRGIGYGASILLHSSFLIVAILAFFFAPSKPVPPPSISVEIVAPPQEQKKAEKPTENVAQPTEPKRSGPEDQGHDAPKAVQAAQPTVQSAKAPQKVEPPREISKPQQQQQKAASQAQQMQRPVPQPVPIRIPIPVPGSMNQMANALFGVKPVVSFGQAGTGGGDPWLNAVKERLGPIHEMLKSEPGVNLPATYVLVIDSAGNIVGVHLQVSAGTERLDNMVIGHVYNTSPVPPPPPGTGALVQVTLEIF